MNIIDILRTNILYFLITLPYTIVLYEFFMSIPFTNMAYIILLFGQILVVPIVYYIIRLFNIYVVMIFPKFLQIIFLIAIILLTLLGVEPLVKLII